VEARKQEWNALQADFQSWQEDQLTQILAKLIVMQMTGKPSVTQLGKDY